MHENYLHGVRIITSPFLTESGEPYEVRRTWLERLFSRPWRPLQATRTVVPQVPMNGFVQMGRNEILMHPAMLEQFERLYNKEHG